MSDLLLDHPESTFIHELRVLPKGKLFIDIGANAGFYAIDLADRYDEVWAVEPYPIFVGQLRENLAKFNIKNVKVIERAVSDRTGRSVFYGNWLCPSGRDNPSLKQNLNLGYEGRRKTLPQKLMEVETITLTELVGDRTVDLIKVDTEGNEKDILWGGQAVMHQIKAWSIEVHDWNETPAITKFLELYGYNVKERGLDSRNRGWLLANRQ